MKVAVPTEDGVLISFRVNRADRFVVAEVELGQILERETRLNPIGIRRRASPRKRRRNSYQIVAELLSDCRAMIACIIEEPMRRELTKKGIDLVLTSEVCLDRALALFSLAALRDESRVPQDELAESLEHGDSQVGDDYDA